MNVVTWASASVATLGVLLPAPAGAAEPPLDRVMTRPLVDVAYYRLANGLRVVLAENHAAPTVTVGVYYKIGFRLEPRGRTGFAHLFEHLMFQGASKNLPKGQFFKLVQGLGGQLNASTRFDHTSYFESAPSNALETVLWAEADRMGALEITEETLRNQKDVVSEEVKSSVLNQPYGEFPWLRLPQHANQNWHNAHNFYGDLRDIEAATVAEARAFRDSYYMPNNAALVLAGDFDSRQAKAWISKYFEPIASRSLPTLPDTSEPEQVVEKLVRYTDPLASQPAIAIGYHVPPRWTIEYFAFGILDEVLLQSTNSRFYQELVQKRGYGADVTGGINPLGTMFDYDGPMLWMASLIHDARTSETDILGAIDDVIERLRREPIDGAELRRAHRSIKSRLYDLIELGGGSSGLVDLLGCFALFDDDPARINRIDAELSAVTAEEVVRVARRYLRRDNRTVLVLQPDRSAREPIP